MPQPTDNPNNSLNLSGANSDLAQVQLQKKAESLIAELSEISTKDSTIISFGKPAQQELEDTRPGDFAEKDPYVDQSVNDSQQDPNSKGRIPTTINNFSDVNMTQSKQNSVNSTNEHIQNDSPDSSTAGGGRTVDDILALLPNYNESEDMACGEGFAERLEESKAAQKKSESSLIPVPFADGPVASPVTKNSVDSNDVSTQTSNDVSTQTNDTSPSLASQPIDASPPLDDMVSEYTPVSWFADSDEQSVVASPSSFPTSVPVMTEDPFTGEQVYDINDFSELAEEPILPIPGALKSDHESTPAAEQAQNQIETKSESDLPQSNQVEAPKSTRNNTLAAEFADGSDLDAELEKAMAACDTIADPVCDDRSVSFAEESFGNSLESSVGKEQIFTPGPIVAEKAATSKPVAKFDETTFTESWNSTEKDELFLAGEGDVIKIDGNDGYDFIDLACFNRTAAVISAGRIVVTEESGSKFEVQYQNVSHVEFADGVRIELPSA